MPTRSVWRMLFDDLFGGSVREIRRVRGRWARASADLRRTAAELRALRRR